MNNNNLIYLNKPFIKLTSVITFGTYDLFHIGHTNLFDRCKKYGSNLITGISTDKFNKEKGKISVNNENKRMSDCKNYKNVDEVFFEESMELKDEYIKKYNADLLIMGDDWKNKFDTVSIMTKYLPRTPNISSTLLKKKLNLI